MLLFLIFKFSYKNLGVYQYSLILVLFLMLFVSVFLLFLSHKQQALGSSPPLLPKVSPGGVTQGRQTGFGSHSQARVTQGSLLLHWGSMEPRARWGQAQPDPHFAPPKPLCVGQPPPVVCLPCRVGLRAQWIPSTFQSQTPSLSPPPPFPAACPQGLPARLLWGPTHKSTLLYHQPQTKARCPVLPLPWAPPGSSTGFLSLSLSLAHSTMSVNS